jgi:membrane-bound metal-dependent hydrolase YbcI (DUF457 family)
MMARGHLLSGALAGLATAPAVGTGHGWVLTGVWVAACTYGGTVPDLDMPGAWASKTFWPVTYPLALLMRWLSIVVYDLTATEFDRANHGGHRGLTHTAVFCPLFGLALYGLMVSSTYVPAEVAFVIAGGITVGCWAHIAGDCCTFWGCPVWWPVVLPWSGGKRWYCVGVPHSMRFRAGGLDDDEEGNWWQAGGERITTGLLWVACAAVSFSYVPGGYGFVFDLVGSLVDRSTSWMI